MIESIILKQRYHQDDIFKLGNIIYRLHEDLHGWVVLIIEIDEPLIRGVILRSPHTSDVGKTTTITAPYRDKYKQFRGEILLKI